MSIPTIEDVKSWLVHEKPKPKEVTIRVNITSDQWHIDMVTELIRLATAGNPHIVLNQVTVHEID